MPNLMLFTDGSLDTKTRIGFGAYLGINDITLPLADLTAQVKTKQFENTSSTTLELQTLLWAMDEMFSTRVEKITRVVIYSDSQNIVGLPARRSGLEQRDYSSNKGKRLNNAELYQAFYRMMDGCDCQIIKVDGHKPLHTKNAIDNAFSLVDKKSRSALRRFLGENTAIE